MNNLPRVSCIHIMNVVVEGRVDITSETNDKLLWDKRQEVDTVATGRW